jgi:hypothetical protein
MTLKSFLLSARVGFAILLWSGDATAPRRTFVGRCAVQQFRMDLEGNIEAVTGNGAA